MTLSLFAAVIGLAIVGLDPFALFLATGSAAAKVKLNHVRAFALIIVIGTFVMGLAATFLLGLPLSHVNWYSALRTHRWVFIVEAFCGIVLAAWVLSRTRKGPGGDEGNSLLSALPGGGSKVGMTSQLGLSAFILTSTLFDPPFIALVVLGGHRQVWEVIAYWVLYTLISQSPLCAFLIATAFGPGQRFVTWLQGVWERTEVARFHLISVVVGLVSLALAADGLWGSITGHALFWN